MKTTPDLVEAKTLLAELQGAKTADPATPRPAAAATQAPDLAAPPSAAAATAPSACAAVKGSEHVGRTRDEVIAALGQPAKQEPFDLKDAKFMWSGFATQKEGMKSLRYENGDTTTRLLVGKDAVVAAVFVEHSAGGDFGSLPPVSEGPLAAVTAGAETWLVIPYVNNDGYAQVGTSASCGTGRVLMKAYCPVGEPLSACGQGDAIYFVDRGFAPPPEAKTKKKALPLASRDVQALPD